MALKVVDTAVKAAATVAKVARRDQVLWSPQYPTSCPWPESCLAAEDDRHRNARGTARRWPRLWMRLPQSSVVVMTAAWPQQWLTLWLRPRMCLAVGGGCRRADQVTGRVPRLGDVTKILATTVKEIACGRPWQQWPR